MKIIFIKPNMISGTPSDSIEPLVFAILSSLTPESIERSFYDERLEDIPFDEPADLVAISADTFTAKRAYQISVEYKKRGVPVVLGGFHPTLCPDEARQYADSVVLGDAEDTWPRIIADVENNRLKPRYESQYLSFGKNEPDRSVFIGKKYAPVRLVEFNRGCRFACDFCSISAMYKGKIRHQTIQNVLRDIESVKGKHIFFTDDNLYFDISLLEKLLNELIKRKIKWSCQISSDIMEYPSIIPLMAKSGCISVTIGFESLNKKNMEQMHKSWMKEDFIEIIKAFQKNGIMIYGTFIIGYDYDTPDIFKKTLDFVLENNFFLANFNPLIPTPGTPLYKRWQAEHRLIMSRWWLSNEYRWGNSVFQPRQMNPEALTQGCYDLRKSLNKTGNIISRFPGLKIGKSSMYKAALFLMANIVSRRELNRKYGKPLGDVSSDAELDTKGLPECI